MSTCVSSKRTPAIKEKLESEAAKRKQISMDKITEEQLHVEQNREAHLKKVVAKAQSEVEKVSEVVANRAIKEWETAEKEKMHLEIAHKIAESNHDRLLEEKRERAAAEVEKAKMIAAKVKEERVHLAERVRK